MNDIRQVIRRKGTAIVASTEQLNLFATVPLGAEELTAAELVQLEATEVKAVRGGVGFVGGTSQLLRSRVSLSHWCSRAVGLAASDGARACFADPLYPCKSSPSVRSVQPGYFMP